MYIFMGDHTNPLTSLLVTVVFSAPLILLHLIKQYNLTLIYSCFMFFVLISAIGNSRWAHELIITESKAIQKNHYMGSGGCGILPDCGEPPVDGK